MSTDELAALFGVAIDTVQSRLAGAGIGALVAVGAPRLPTPHLALLNERLSHAAAEGRKRMAELGAKAR
ncbi:MAG: hypothetical protein HYX69_06940 [Planctomycetia bacterium]|nr:hypothetical protein [Planctomycetia bacterium]